MLDGGEKIRWGMVENEVCSDLCEDTKKVLEEMKTWVAEGIPSVCEFFAKYPLLKEGGDPDLEIECGDINDLISGISTDVTRLSEFAWTSKCDKLDSLGKSVRDLQRRFSFLIKLNFVVSVVSETHGEEECFEVFGAFRDRMKLKGHKPDTNFFLNWFKVCKDFDHRKYVLWMMAEDGVKINEDVVLAWFEMICKDSNTEGGVRSAESETKSAEISAWVAQARKKLKLPMSFFKDLLANTDGSFARITVFETFMQNGDWDRRDARDFFEYWRSLLDPERDSGEIKGICKIYKPRLEACGYDCYRLKREPPPVRRRDRSSGRS
ncbi:hypothetical protein HOG17_02375 [Candidatus Peregrinibacteria bacterium]|jgi:hypothetical protein|nr:hypothetical protein [Candidatus Peregrinibacteria bacterium]MBT4147892.1 hypothetical protein [Candidatus Peregrinibacteria bacterium]MBT4365909.1 hypothetical protein [Candidatus Peregrinibacteria bacterium]MBT4456383.1 hypothetical protein [Candidatus Peregrinibacteria bacterium]